MNFWTALLRLFKKPTPAPPQPKQYRIAVMVQDRRTSRGIEGVDVTIGPATFQTNQDGYGSTVLPFGIYRLTLTHPGYHTAFRGGIVAGASEEIWLTLEPLKVTPDRAMGDALLNVRGNFCNLWDDEGRIVYTPALPGAAAHGLFDDWMRIQREAGSTHVFVGPFEGGDVYPGIPFANPDLLSDTTALRAFIERILDTPSADGLGFRPVIFLDGGGRDPRPRIDAVWPRIFAALDGLQPNVIVIPAWEPVVGDWSSADVAYALQAIPDGWIIGYHGSPKRLVGSSNPLEPDDPWHGGESKFYQSHGGERIQVAFYQTEHGHDIYGDCNEDESSCWLDRWQDYVMRIGAGVNGWRTLHLVAFETVAYEAFRGQATSSEARDVASRMTRVSDKWGVRIGYGNGLPW